MLRSQARGCGCGCGCGHSCDCGCWGSCACCPLHCSSSPLVLRRGCGCGLGWGRWRSCSGTWWSSCACVAWLVKASTPLCRVKLRCMLPCAAHLHLHTLLCTAPCPARHRAAASAGDEARLVTVCAQPKQCRGACKRGCSWLLLELAQPLTARAQTVWAALAGGTEITATAVMGHASSRGA